MIYMKCNKFIKDVINFWVVILGVVLLGINYQYGLYFCDLYNIPFDFSLSMMGIGVAMEIGLFLFALECIFAYLGWCLLRRIFNGKWFFNRNS